MPNLTVPLRSASELERLQTAAYRFAETQRDGVRPAVVANSAGAFPIAHVMLKDDEAARAFQTFWSGFRGRLDMAA